MRANKKRFRCRGRGIVLKLGGFPTGWRALYSPRPCRRLAFCGNDRLRSSRFDMTFRPYSRRRSSRALVDRKGMAMAKKLEGEVALMMGGPEGSAPRSPSVRPPTAQHSPSPTRRAQRR